MFTPEEKEVILSFFKEFSLVDSDYESTVLAASVVKKLKEMQ